MQFEFATATRIIFGSGKIKEAVPLIKQLGKKIIVVTGSSNERARPLLNLIETEDIEITTFNVSGEPTVEVVLNAVQKARDAKCDVVAGIGGGSVLDTGKVVSALLTNDGDLMDYLEVIGKGQPLSTPTSPYIAIPTTAGTGAEVTRNAVIDSPEHRVKVSMRSPLMLPDVAIVDPELSYSMSPKLTACTGLDALTQVIEPYVSIKANPLTDALCREGIIRGARSLLKAYQNGSNAEAREDMSLVNLFGGLALANAKLGAVHGFAGPLGGMFPAPHGAICARLLPYVMAANVRALQTKQPESPIVKRFDEVAQFLTGDKTATAPDGVTWIQNLCEELNVPPLREYGLTENDFKDVIEKSGRSSSMKGNPIVLKDEELREILHKAV